MEDESGTKSEGLDGIYVGKGGGGEETANTFKRPQSLRQIGGRNL